MAHRQTGIASVSDGAARRSPVPLGHRRPIAVRTGADGARTTLFEAIRSFGLTTSRQRGAQIFAQDDRAAHWYLRRRGAIELPARKLILLRDCAVLEDVGSAS
jgi:hypothetical protein